MTEFSLNTEFENLIKATLTDQEATETNGRNDNGTGKKPRRISKNPDFFQDNNAVKKKFFCKPYTNAGIKS